MVFSLISWRCQVVIVVAMYGDTFFSLEDPPGRLTFASSFPPHSISKAVGGSTPCLLKISTNFHFFFFPLLRFPSNSPTLLEAREFMSSV